MMRRLKTLFGFGLEAEDGKLGKLHDVYFDEQTWMIRYIVVDTGGFLGGRHVLLSPSVVKDVDWDEKRVHLSLTKTQVEGSPEVDFDRPITRETEMGLQAHYGWPAYWSPFPTAGLGAWPAPAMGPMPGVPVPPVPSEAAPENKELSPERAEDFHLRSAREVTGYAISARDGDIGHVEDLLVEEDSWTIRYMIVDTRDWLPGRNVLVSPQWITAINWTDMHVRVNLTRDGVRNSPEYDPSQPPERGYEEKLHRHYGQRHYWS